MKRLILALALLALSAPADAARIECITPASIVAAANCTEADVPWDCCTGSGAGATCPDLSATAIRVKSGGPHFDIEVYSSANAEDPPATCTPILGGGSAVTCAGWDTSGEVEIWTKCDRNAPWLQIENTAAIDASTNTVGAKKYGRDLESDCLVALKITNTGAGGDVCAYLSITGATSLDRKQEVQDGDNVRWTDLVDEP